MHLRLFPGPSDGHMRMSPMTIHTRPLKLGFVSNKHYHRPLVSNQCSSFKCPLICVTPSGCKDSADPYIPSLPLYLLSFIERVLQDIVHIYFIDSARTQTTYNIS